MTKSDFRKRAEKSRADNQARAELEVQERAQDAFFVIFAVMAVLAVSGGIGYLMGVM